MMRKLLGPVSVVVICLSLIQLYRLSHVSYAGAALTDNQREAVESILSIPASDPIEIRTAAELVAAANNVILSFADFPESELRDIDFDIDEETLARLTPRQVDDQMLDWLLVTVVQSAGLSADKLAQVLFDLPALRYAYLRTEGELEFGLTRSRAIGDGRVVALIPERSSRNEIYDHLAHVADEHRKNLGNDLEQIIPFFYNVDALREVATIRRGATVNAQDCFSQDYGHRQRLVRNLADLKAFMSETDDLVSARLVDGGLELGGRQLRASRYRGIRVEDVAAIWQSEQLLADRWAEFKKQSIILNSAYKIRWANKTYSNVYERLELERQSEQEWAAIEEELRQLASKLQLQDGSGFSLDQTYDFSAMADSMESLKSVFEWQLTMDQQFAAKYTEVFERLKERDAHALDNLVEYIFLDGKMGPQLNRLLEASNANQFQIARYDGELRGTEVGMILFYTDLLAKLWSIDFNSSAPQEIIPGFITDPTAPVSDIYAVESDELPSARLWFGPANKGFALSADRRDLRFARLATRIFSKGSNPKNPFSEVQTSAQFAASIDWWNDHYEEVAAHEQEYQRLNEVMKWSILLGWLGEMEKTRTLAFLDDVNVVRSKWFETWALNNSDLKFTAWDAVGLFPPGYQGNTLECLPRLSSRLFLLHDEINFVTGGVSLAPTSMFKGRVGVSSRVGQLSRRSNINFKTTNAKSGRFTTLDGTEFTLNQISATRSGIKSIPKRDLKLRGVSAEIANTSNTVFERVVIRHSRNMKLESRVADRGIGELGVYQTNRGFRVEWRARDIDAGQSLARRVSKQTNIEEALLNDSGLEAVIKLEGTNTYAMRLNGSRGWLKLAPETTPSSRLAQGWHSRVCDAEAGLHNIQLAWLDDAALNAHFKGEGWFVLEPAPGKARTRLVYNATRGPPPEANGIKLEVAGHRFPAALEPETGAIHIKYGDLPQAYRRDIASLHREITLGDLVDVRQMVAAGKKPVLHSGTPGPRFTSYLRQRNYRSAAQDLINDPVAIRQEVYRQLGKDFQTIDKLIDEGQFVRASQLVEDLSGVYGPLPELRLRGAVAQLRRGRYRQVAEDLAAIRHGPLRDRAGFFDEINARLRNPNASPAEKTNLKRVAEFFDWQDMQARGVMPEHRIIPLVSGENVTWTCKLQSRSPGTRVNPSELEAVGTRSPIYVQDTPALSNVDWSVSIEHSLQQLGPSQRVQILKIPHEGISTFRPGRIYGSDGTTGYHLIQAGGPVQASTGWRLPYTPRRIPPATNDPDDDETTTDHSHIFLIVADQDRGE